MFRTFIAFGFCFCILVLHAQPRKQFSVNEKPSCSSIDLRLGAKSGNYFIEPGRGVNLISAFSNLDPRDATYFIEDHMVGAVQRINLEMEGFSGAGFTHSISDHVWGPHADIDEHAVWKFELTENKPFNLDLVYAVGNADLDLSGLSIERLKINSGSANIRISYETGPNKIAMDTFQVKVDLGSLIINNINDAHTRFFNAEVGFGKLYLDFSQSPVTQYIVHGIVGAGTMDVIMPEENIPVKLHINDSWLSTVVLPPHYREIDENVFVNTAYLKGQPDPIIFNFDIAMGNIVIHTGMDR
jgi:hypothetical protein